MKRIHMGYILSGAEMERLMRRPQRAKQEFVQNEQTGDGDVSLGCDVLSVDRQTRANVQPVRLGMSNEQALKATFLGNAENFGVLELLQATQRLLDDYYVGQPLLGGITVDYLRELQRHLFDPMTAWQSRTPKLKPDCIRILEALQQAAINFVLNSKEAANLIKKRTLTPNISESEPKREHEQPESKDDFPFADVHNPLPETVSESEFLATKELAEAQWRAERESSKRPRRCSKTPKHGCPFLERPSR